MGLTLRFVPKKKESATEFGRRLVQLRLSRGLTQMQLAASAGTSQRVISRYERGGLLLRGKLIATLAGILRIFTDELLGVHTARSRSTEPIAPVVDECFARRFSLFGAIPRRDRETVSRTIDALVAARGAA